VGRRFAGDLKNREADPGLRRVVQAKRALADSANRITFEDRWKAFS